MTKFFKLVSILSTFLPVWVIVVFKLVLEIIFNLKIINVYFYIYLSLVCIFLVFSVILTLILILFLKTDKKRVGQNFNVEVMNVDKKNFSTDFLVAYLLPLLSFFNTDNNPKIDLINLFVCVVLLIIISFLAYKESYIFINIIIVLLNYKQYIVNVKILYEGNEYFKNYIWITKNNLENMKHNTTNIKVIDNFII